jgi:hypothetical protein
MSKVYIEGDSWYDERDDDSELLDYELLKRQALPDLRRKELDAPVGVFDYYEED